MYKQQGGNYIVYSKKLVARRNSNANILLNLHIGLFNLHTHSVFKSEKTHDSELALKNVCAGLEIDYIDNYSYSYLQFFLINATNSNL